MCLNTMNPFPTPRVTVTQPSHAGKSQSGAGAYPVVETPGGLGHAHDVA
jgi:hypothetical protein